MTTIQIKLFEMQDKKYKNFTTSLIPTINPDNIIGVRIPALRKFSSELFKSPERYNFMNSLPHKYYEENNLHGFLIEKIKDYETCIHELDKFLPYIDNWSTCDSINPKVFKTHKTELLKSIHTWLNSNHTYSIRYAIKLLMSHYLDDNFETKYSDTVASIKSDEYYINMMIAWYFATALAKQYDKIVPYLEKNILTKNVHNKTIQKSIESLRISSVKKKYLKTLRR